METAAAMTAAAIQRLGTESAFAVLLRAAELERQGRRIVNLGIGQPDFRTPEHIVEAARKALADGHHGYTPSNGILPLREAVAEDISLRRRVEVDPDHVVIVPGGKVTMWHAILMFGEPGVEILYPNPGFPIYESAIRYSGATPVPIRLDEANGFMFDADAVLEQITPRTRLLILNSPANPTGGVLSREVLDRLAAGLDAHPSVAVLSDEIYARMLYGEEPHATLLAYPHLKERVILLDGWSKTYAMTGWRIGYAVWPAALVDAAIRLNVNSVSCTNAAAQHAAIAALRGPQDAVNRMVAAFRERRQAMVDLLRTVPGFSVSMPEGAFYAMPNISRTGLRSAQMQETLLEELGVATVAGTSFGAYGEGFVRFSYAASREDIRQAICDIRGYGRRMGWGG